MTLVTPSSEEEEDATASGSDEVSEQEQEESVSSDDDADDDDGNADDNDATEDDDATGGITDDNDVTENKNINNDELNKDRVGKDKCTSEVEGDAEGPQSASTVTGAYQSALDFSDLGVNDVLCTAVKQLKWKKPTKIQCESIPLALEGRDVIGLAETGSGKTGAFALPILQRLLAAPQRLYGVVLTPTRELAYQISEQFQAIGGSIGVKCAVLVGGMDMMAQSLTLAKRPHVIIATPGRLVDHLENTKGFSLRQLKCLVMDEADRILNMDFGVEVDKIIQAIPRDRQTYLFSATMTKKVRKLQRAALKDPVKVEVSSRFQTVDKLQQYYLFIPAKYKDVYLVSVVTELAGNSFMIFCSTCNNALRVSYLLNALGLPALPLHGQMNMNKRLGALNKFKAKNKTILVATDVASRGLDIEHVDVVINFDIPTHSKDYIHRVGRTARAGRTGRSVTFVTQYDVELYQRIEHLIGKKLPEYPCREEEVMMLQERVAEADRHAKQEMRAAADKDGNAGGRRRKRGRNNAGNDEDHDDDDGGDDEAGTGYRKRLTMKKNNRNKKKRARN